MRLLSTLVLGLATLTAVAGAAGIAAVPFATGPSRFLPGDALVIDEVVASSPRFEPGDRIRVRGHYRLQSHPQARLSLLVTEEAGAGTRAVVPAASRKVAAGADTFDLSCEIRAAGVLHVTLYSSAGRPFGGQYFGTAEQMKRIAHWSLSDYEAAP